MSVSLKQYIAFAIFTTLIVAKPTPVSHGQDTTKQKKIEKEIPKKDTLDGKTWEYINGADSLRGLKKNLFREQLKNQELIKKKLTPRVIYVKVFVEQDVNKKYGNDYIIVTPEKLNSIGININDSITEIPVLTFEKKKTFTGRLIQRLFHHKKNKK